MVVEYKVWSCFSSFSILVSIRFPFFVFYILVDIVEQLITALKV